MNNTNKNPHSCERGFLFGRDGWDRTNEMQESKSCALPLGYIPMQPRHYTTYQQLCQEQLWQLIYLKTTMVCVIILKSDKEDPS